MRPIFFLILLGLIACKKSDRSAHITPVEVDSVNIPTTSTLSNPVRIHATASAGNGCYNNFNFKLSKVSAFKYRLRAYANYESAGLCPTVIVHGDTTINFIPKKRGTYVFEINEKPFDLKTANLLVD